jgi:choline dehydrogenase-like flavoprotein
VAEDNTIFDYIVVGGGVAGCVVAARLSEVFSVRVLMLEEGPNDKSIFIKAAGGFFKIHGTKRTFNYSGEPEPGSNNRGYALIQGRCLGGGLSVNAMVYMRGQHQDYDDWKEAGCTGWGYDDVLPYFRKSESNYRYSLPYHGADGPLRISDGDHRHELTGAFLRAAQEAGYSDGRPIRFNADFNGETQEGVGFYQTFSYRGQRESTASAYIESARNRPNLAVRTDTMVSRIIVQGRRAAGVLARGREGETTYTARQEVILCAGAFMSPKLLMLSGIGPAEHLRSFGIDVVADVAGVGSNYQDHLITPVDALLRDPISLVGQDRGFNAVRNGVQWLLFKTGPLASTVVEGGGFLDVDGDGRPDINLNALAVSSAGWGDPLPQGEHRFSLAPLCLTCHSRGEIRLRSTNAADPPRVTGNFLSHPIEMSNLVGGVRLARRIMNAPSLRKYLKAEVLPGAGVDDQTKGLEEYIRNRTTTGLHATSTCAMGADETSVVDLQLRVRGVHGLRVVDASVMPLVVRGNTAAPTIMVAERASDFISGRRTSPAATAEAAAQR